MNIDLTPVFQAVIALLAAVVTYKAIPWIKSNTNERQFTTLTSIANVAVYAAQQVYNSGQNKEKLSYAMDYATRMLKNMGFTVDTHTVRAAIEKAVYELKNQPVAAEAVEVLETVGNTGTGYYIPPLEDWPTETIIAFCECNGIAHDEGRIY